MNESFIEYLEEKYPGYNNFKVLYDKAGKPTTVMVLDGMKVHILKFKDKENE